MTKAAKQPVDMVRLTAYIPKTGKSIVITRDEFDVPMIEKVMFMNEKPESQFLEEHLDKVISMSNNAFNPMAGYICRREDEKAGRDALEEFYKSKSFIKAVKDTGTKSVKAYRDQIVQIEKRVEFMVGMIPDAKIRIEDITGMTEEDLNKSRDERRAKKKPAKKAAKKAPKKKAAKKAAKKKGCK